MLICIIVLLLVGTTDMHLSGGVEEARGHMRHALTSLWKKMKIWISSMDAKHYKQIVLLLPQFNQSFIVLIQFAMYNFTTTCTYILLIASTRISTEDISQKMKNIGRGVICYCLRKFPFIGMLTFLEIWLWLSRMI